MNVRTLVVGALAVACGLSAMFLIQALRRPPSGPVIEKVSVVFAAADVKPGETLQEAMLEVREIPKVEVPEDAILKTSDAIDRAALSQLDKGDLLRERKLAERGAGRGMAALIKSGMRAITIPTPSFSTSMAGFLLPGNKVDILLTTNSSGGPEDDAGGASTTTLLQNVEILAVHTTVNAPTANKIDPDQARSVTVQVSPEDANRLQLGQMKGTLHLSLRNMKDTANTTSRPANMADIGVLRATKPAPILPPAPGVELPKGPPMPEREAPKAFEDVPAGMRAFTITTSTHAASMVTTIRPGHRVDVLLTTDPKSEKGVSTTLLQDQEVLDIHPTLNQGTGIGSGSAAGSPEEVRAITLLVTPRDAELLDLAENSGLIHLALRPDGEEDDSKPAPVTMADLQGGPTTDDPKFRVVTQRLRTLRGTAYGANSMEYVVPVNAPVAEATPKPRPARRPRTKPSPNVAGGVGLPASGVAGVAGPLGLRASSSP